MAVYGYDELSHIQLNNEGRLGEMLSLELEMVDIPTC